MSNRKQWFKDRFYQKADFLRRQWSEDIPDVTGITTIAAVPADCHWYTLGGQQLSQRPTWKGIYVHNGKKVVVR